MKFIKETNIDDYANQLQARLQREYDLVCSMLETCKEGVFFAGETEYRTRKYEVERIAKKLGFDLDDKGRTTI